MRPRPAITGLRRTRHLVTCLLRYKSQVLTLPSRLRTCFCFVYLSSKMWAMEMIDFGGDLEVTQWEKAAHTTL